VDVADADFPRRKQREYPQARAISEGFEKILEAIELIVRHLSIIFAFANEST